MNCGNYYHHYTIEYNLVLHPINTKSVARNCFAYFIILSFNQNWVLFLLTLFVENLNS